MIVRTSRLPHTFIALAVVSVLAACGGEPSGDAPADAQLRSDAQQAPVVDLASDKASEYDEAPAASAGFDIASVPVSEQPLGDFPYLSLPSELTARDQRTLEFDRFPFWVGDRMVWVEGKVFSAGFAGKDDQQYSPYGVHRNVESVVAAAGGRKVANGQIPSAMTDTYQEDDIAVRYVDGLGDLYNNPTSTYLIRRPDRDIWVHLSTNNYSGGWVIAETKPFVASAQLLPASELKQTLDSAGKVALQVNFATDKAEILPDSKPQIEQVVALLKDDPELKLSVNGHTDNTGDATHNQQLSEARAAAVVAALTGGGIDGSRLQAKGFGQAEPVADNSTEEGKARNRRVELVQL
ncbi:OmpA family protein [Lysobacter sp. F60174L2]|uniref:OmpA family protein n=1 Tax=Lysobacter sp. F60174L2 TaxID=3459295 RepID=UPI00403DD434